MDDELPECLPEDCLVDNSEIDRQHAQIFGLIASLSASFPRHDPPVFSEFKGLLRLIALHFAAEARMAKKRGVEFSAHAAIHRENLQQMRDALDVVAAGLSDPLAFLRYVEFWFLRHIVQYDRPFAVRLHSQSSGVAAE